MDAAVTQKAYSFALRLKKQSAQVHTRTYFVRRPRTAATTQLLDLLYDRTGQEGDADDFYCVQGCSRGDVVRAPNAELALKPIEAEVLRNARDLLAEHIKNESVGAHDGVHFETRIKQLMSEPALRLAAFPKGQTDCTPTARPVSFLPLFVVPLVAFAYSAGCSYQTDAQRKELFASLRGALDASDTALCKGNRVQREMLSYIVATPPMWCNMSRAEEEATAHLCGGGGSDDSSDGDGAEKGKVYHFSNVKEANCAAIISGFFPERNSRVTVVCRSVTSQARRHHAEFDKRFGTTTRFVVSDAGVNTRAGKAALKRNAAAAAATPAEASSSSSDKRQKTDDSDGSSDVEICRVQKK